MAADRQRTEAKSGEPGAPDHPKDKRAEYLTARQLADVLQVSESTIHRLRRAGRIPAVLLTDRLIRFNLREVQRALRPIASAHAHERESEQEEPSPQMSFENFFPASSEE
ncbi:MAG TPA: helix-turn-helix domain-containing protein [Blastocatellia bacterium]|nr:helix-turn-helix domain-containing protein [Blastocatellia bacterium]